MKHEVHDSKKINAEKPHALDQAKIDEAIKRLRKDVFGSFKQKRSQVVPRFQKIRRTGTRTRLDRMFYDYDNDKYTITLKPESIKFLNENYDSLYSIPILRWAEYLRTANPDSDIKPFLKDQGIILSDGIQNTLIKYLNDIIPSNSSTGNLSEYCKNTRDKHDDASMYLVSTQPRHIAKMFEETVRKPISPKILEKNNIPNKVKNRSEIAVFGVNSNYCKELRNAVVGDVLLFFNKKKVYASSTIISNIQNKDIQKILWKTSKSDMRLILFLTKIEDLDIKLDVLYSFFDIRNKQESSIEMIDKKKQMNLSKKFGNIRNAVKSLNDYYPLKEVLMTTSMGLVNNRIGAKKFREQVLIDNFDNKCALCNISDKDLLEAAHIISFSEGKETRGRIDNGICLCVMHHKMFDRNYFDINGEYQVSITKNKISEPSKYNLRYSKINTPTFPLNVEYLDLRLVKSILNP